MRLREALFRERSDAVGIDLLYYFSDLSPNIIQLLTSPADKALLYIRTSSMERRKNVKESQYYWMHQ